MELLPLQFFDHSAKVRHIHDLRSTHDKSPEINYPLHDRSPQEYHFTSMSLRGANSSLQRVKRANCTLSSLALNLYLSLL
jgi:hypothetical protein